MDNIKEAEAKCLDGADEEQVRMMEERVILLNLDDEVIGHASKKDSHLNSNIDAGMLHRAFSVFLFNSKGELLMQQRSDDKITFPAFWANSCCSHPLHREAELEAKDQLGVKRAARRKMEQELGIDPEEVPLSSFTFLTRVHYKAVSDGVWGEHEIDYILICKPPADVTLRPNVNEVQSARYFSRTALDDFVRNADKNGDLVSPWFRVIHSTLVPQWWDALEAGQLETMVDLETIHRAGDSPNTNAGDHYDKLKGSGGAETRTGDTGKKQGAYGKVKIHKESKWSQLMQFSEIAGMVQYKLSGGLGETPITGSDDLDFCDEILGQVSRSFAAVIRQLPDGLRVEICIFYLALRALDTVEDDMTAFADAATKSDLLCEFYLKLSQPKWTLEGVGEGDERRLLEQFGGCSRVFLSLSAAAQDVIADITRRMGCGMAEFVSKDLGQGTVNIEEYNRYCHFVAGLVGEGLSRLFTATGFEGPDLAADTELANSMGLFLQKTNIIRDYLEDYVDGRAFWPQEVWKLYASDLGDLSLPQNRQNALNCLNHLISDALDHVPDCMSYLTRLSDPKVFRFCAIPQVMAIATLEKLYNNADVFTGVVKIRKGLSCKLILRATTFQETKSLFSEFLRRVGSKSRAITASSGDVALALRERTAAAVSAGLEATGGAETTGSLTSIALLAVPITVAAVAAFISTY